MSMNLFSKFMERGGDPKYQKDFKNQLRDPILLVDDLRTPFYKKILPDLLHCIKLGVMQDIIHSIQRRPHLSGVMRDFLVKLGLYQNRAGMAGNLFNGEQIDIFCREENLRDLFEVLSENGEKTLGFYTVKYLHACKQLYKVCVKKTLDPDYQKYFDEYRKYFEILFQARYINMTPKAHLILDHFSDIMRESGRTLFLADCQGLESVHCALRRSDIRHGCHITNRQGTPLHEEMSIRSVSFYNSRTLGFTIPACEEPPDPDPDLNNDVSANNDDVPPVNNEVEINERNCETPPAGFNGDQLENESEEYLRDHLDVQDDNEDDNEENNAEKKELVKRILNGQGNNIVYSLDQVYSHIRDKNLQLVPRKKISPDGNCFFESCGDLADKFDINVPRDKFLLRQLLVDSMKDHPEYPRWLELCCEGDEEVFDLTAEELRKDGTYTDASGWIVMTAACVLGDEFSLFKNKHCEFIVSCSGEKI